jgi:exonuclease III
MIPATIKNDLRICSYNSRGHGLDRPLYMKDLMKNCDVMFVQENWFFDFEIGEFTKFIDDVNAYGVSGMDSHTPLTGRRFGGCAIVYRKTLNCSFTPIDSKNRRVCAMMMNLNDGPKILLICVYMPCDTSYDIMNLQFFNDVLNEIEFIIDSHPDHDHVIVGGDFNTDLSRADLSLHNAPLHDMCDRQCLKSCLRCSASTVDYTYHNEFTGSKSILDHFFLSELLFHGQILAM